MLGSPLTTATEDKGATALRASRIQNPRSRIRPPLEAKRRTVEGMRSPNTGNRSRDIARSPFVALARTRKAKHITRTVMAGRARLSSARRAAIDGVRRRAEDRRALPPAVTEAL